MALPISGGEKKGRKTSQKSSQATLRPVLWQAPGDLSKRDLFRGSGGAGPQGTLTFVKEDLDGASAKFTARDSAGTLWKVKLGPEAVAETAATRLVWAVGYFTDETFFYPELRIAKLKMLRGEGFIKDGVVLGARLEKPAHDWKKVGTWKWREPGLAGTRELEGLKALMALMNNWDLKTSNNAVYEAGRDPSARIYVVSDLGSSFGTAGFHCPPSGGKNSLNAYAKSKFIEHLSAETVDFRSPARPAAIYFIAPNVLRQRLPMRALGDDIPRTHARWMADLLARLSPEQIRDAFRAAGNSAEDVEGFARVVEARIAAMREL